jgi:hypothetical protein
MRNSPRISLKLRSSVDVENRLNVYRLENFSYRKMFKLYTRFSYKEKKNYLIFECYDSNRQLDPRFPKFDNLFKYHIVKWRVKGEDQLNVATLRNNREWDFFIDSLVWNFYNGKAVYLIFDEESYLLKVRKKDIKKFIKASKIEPSSLQP